MPCRHRSERRFLQLPPQRRCLFGGLPGADHYTMSTALRKTSEPQAVAKTLALLDRSGIKVCSDEVLFNCTLEACIRRKESNFLPSVHTCGEDLSYLCLPSEPRPGQSFRGLRGTEARRAMP